MSTSSVKRSTLTSSVLYPSLARGQALKKYLLSGYLYTWMGKQMDRQISPVALIHLGEARRVVGREEESPAGSPLGISTSPTRLSLQ